MNSATTRNDPELKVLDAFIDLAQTLRLNPRHPEYAQFVGPEETKWKQRKKERERELAQEQKAVAA